MNGTDLEKELVEWSNRQAYVLGERLWGVDIEAEIDYEFENLNKGSEAVFLPGSTISLKQMMDWADGDKGLAKKLFTGGFGKDLVREIYVPTGLVRYTVALEGRQLEDGAINPVKNEADYLEKLKSGQRPYEEVTLFHGPRIEDWRNKKITPSYRIAFRNIQIGFTPFNPENDDFTRIGDESFDIRVEMGDLAKNDDPISKALYGIFQLNRKHRKGGSKVDMIMNGFEAPANSETYKSILNNWTDIIGSTEVNFS